MTPLIISSSSESNNDHDDTNDVYPWFKTWHVHPVTRLSKSKIMLVRCKSKDIDLGINNFTVGIEFNWKFRLRILEGMIFWCYMVYTNLHAAFKVFWEDRD
ncbi:hypothetical protein Gogos_019910, partial [Gossypium gossypioides]|nr:hypothetical protein [Gossypium gossypioides]